MFDEKEESLKLKLLEMLMEEMDGVTAEKLKKPVAMEVEIESEGDPEAEMLMGAETEDESPEDKLRRRIEAMRK